MEAFDVVLEAQPDRVIPGSSSLVELTLWVRLGDLHAARN
jgi:hypothetical protein